MPEPPAPRPPAMSEFYVRKRRLAYHFAWLSMTFLAILLFQGSLLEFISHPRASASEGVLCLLHRCITDEDAEGSRLLVLDTSLKPRGESLRLLDTATAALPEAREITVFYGDRAAALGEGGKSRPFDLGQKWDVLAAAADPARSTAWIFGWHEGRIVARRRDGEVWSGEIEIAKSLLVERVAASMEGTRGPLVAWREKDGTLVKSALFGGESFAPRPDVEIGDVQHWDAVLSGGRTLVATYHREDRSFQYVTLRLECCPGCAAPLAPRKVAFLDPVLRLGRRVTGLAAVAAGGRLRFFVTRSTAVMSASLPLETLQAEPGARLAEVSVDPPWRFIVGVTTPLLILFFSFSLVFLGITLLRERARVTAEASPATRGGEPILADLLTRVMAYFLDIFPLIPLCIAVSGVMAVSVEDMEDPHYFTMLAIWAGIELVYRFTMEWALGWTIGKRILGIRVTSADGSRVTLRGALVRNLARIVDAQLPFGMILGAALMLRTRRRQRLGDLAAGTVVVLDRPPGTDPAS